MAALAVPAGPWDVAWGAPAPVPAPVQPLLSQDWATWLAGLDALRGNAQAASLLAQALAVQPAPARAWRLAHHFAEFGSLAQAPALLAVAANPADAREYREAVGSLGALYVAEPQPPDLYAVLTELVFVPQDQPQPYAPDQAGKVLLGADAYDAFEVLDWPQGLIERLRPLQDHAYADRPALETALQSRITPREWQDHQTALRAATQQLPARLTLGGTLRLTLGNPTPRPLLVRVQLEAWHGRFQDAPQPLYALLQPGTPSRIDVPVRLIAPVDPGLVRVDARIREVNDYQALASRKVYVPVRR